MKRSSYPQLYKKEHIAEALPLIPLKVKSLIVQTTNKVRYMLSSRTKSKVNGAQKMH